MFCPNCGKEISDDAVTCNGCGYTLQRVPTQEASNPVLTEKQDNIFTGTVGAFLGAVIGGISIILFSRMGYTSAISGIILAACTIKGYELLGGKKTKRGMIVSLIIMLLTPYIADRIDWALIILDEFPDYGLTFADCFALVPELVADGSIEAGNYYGILAMTYIFVLIGAYCSIFGGKKKKAKKQKVEKEKVEKGIE